MMRRDMLPIYGFLCQCGSTMSRRLPSTAQFTALREAFRANPPARPRDFRDAGRVADVTEATARRAWARGWPGIPPVEVSLAEERAIAAQLPAVLRVETLVAEATAGAAGLHAELRRLQPAVAALVDVLVTRADLGDTASMAPAIATSELARLARVHRDVLAVVRDAVELRRLVDGEATSIIGIKPMPLEVVDLDQARAEVDAVDRALRRHEQARQLAEAPDDGIRH
jgi:hypothetical protein